MVEVFKTNVNTAVSARQIAAVVQQALVNSHVNFDLNDCDKILRIETEGEKIDPDLIVRLLANHDFHAVVLEDNPTEKTTNLKP